MRKLLPFALLVVAVGARADEPVRAPVPKAPVPPSIEGRYVVVLTELQPGFGGPWGGAPGGWGGPGVPAVGPGNPNPLRRSSSQRGAAVVTANAITIGETKMAYTLDATKTPMTIDVETHPLGEKPRKQVGVIEASGDRLTVALAKEGGERPKSVEEADGVTVYYFQKAPPPPRTEYRIVALNVGEEERVEKELNQLAKEGFELVTTTSPTAPNQKASATTIHFVLKRTVK